MHISGLAVRRPIATSMLLLAAVLLGLISLTRLEVTLLPDVTPTELAVWVPYEDAAAPEIEESVVRPIEEALAGARGVRRIESRVVPGGATIITELHPGSNPELVALAIRERLDAVRWLLPDGMGRPVVIGTGELDAPAMVLALAADDLPAAGDWAETVLEPRLEQLDGVARAVVVGAPEREVRIIPDARALETLGLGPAEIARAVGEANIEAPGGYLRRHEIRFALQMSSAFSSPEEIARVVVARRGNRLVRLGDVAEVVDGFSDPEGWSRLDGRPAVGILLTREAEASLLEMSSAVHEKLEEIAAESPDFDVAVVMDPSPFVRESINGVWRAVWLGSLLAYAVLFAFLRDGRSPLHLILALPLSVIITFAVLDVLGISLNLLSLGGIALGVGMLVDNAIICLENIHRLRAAGHPAPVAAAEGAREIAMPILASTLTTCAVFAPLAFVPGTVGELFRDQAIAVSVSLFVSLIIALTLLPMLAGRFAPATTAAPRLPLYGTYHHLLVRALRQPRLVLGVTAAVSCGAIALVAEAVPREMFPAIATENLEIELALPPGTDVAATDAAVQEIERWLDDRDEVASIYAGVGSAGALDLTQRGRESSRARIRATLTPHGVNDRGALEDALRAAFADRASWLMSIVPDRPELASLTPSGEPTITCQVSGPDPELAETLAAAILERAAADPRVPLAGSATHLRLEAARHEPAYRLTVREDVLARHGLSEEEALAAVQSLTSGLEATKLRRFDEEHPVVIRQAALTASHASDGETGARNGTTPGTDPSAVPIVVGGRTFRVGELFDVRLGLAPARLLRENQTRVATIAWDGSLRRVDGVRAALDAAVDATALPSGYSVRFGGTHAAMQATLVSVTKAFALSAGLVLLILAAQFESVRLPFVIFAAVPLAAVGVALALLLTRGSLNVMTGIGAVVLIGIVVNDAILKIDLLRRLSAEGHSMREAIMTASRQRYRPILMTTATTSLALVPLFFGRGAELYGPLAATVIGGLVSATVLTLIVIPVLSYVIAGSRAEAAAVVRAGVLTGDRS